jgi:hypothetical protein
MYVHWGYMATFTLWSVGFALELLILVRFLWCRLVGRYPLFFGYIAIVGITSAALWPIYLYHPSAYKPAFWAAEFFTLLTGFGVMLELVQKCLERYAGARRYATIVLVSMFAALFAYFAYPLLAASTKFSTQHFSLLDRDFRAVQAVTIAGLLAVISYYRIDIGRNLRGILGGFGLYVGSTILSHELRGYLGSSFDAAWNLIQPWTYLISLVIWLLALWTYAPGPDPDEPPDLDDDDYSGLARTTREELVGLRAQVGREERR